MLHFFRLNAAAAIAKKNGMWCHSDAAYGASGLVVPQFRHLMAGVDDVDSLNMSLHKMFLISNTCGMLWVKEQLVLQGALHVDPIYLKKTYPDATDFRHFGTSLSRRTKSLKVWLLLRLYGTDGIQAYVKRLADLAQRVKRNIDADKRLEVVGDVHLSLVCFRVKKASLELMNKATTELHDVMVRSSKLMISRAEPTRAGERHTVIRICLSQERLQEQDVDHSWSIIKDLTDKYFAMGTHDSMEKTVQPSLTFFGNIDDLTAAGPRKETPAWMAADGDVRRRHQRDDSAGVYGKASAPPLYPII